MIIIEYETNQEALTNTQETKFNVVWLCMKCTIYIHGRSHKKGFIDNLRWQLQSFYTRDYKQQEDPLSLFNLSGKLS